MMLAIDCGNTRIKWGLFDRGELSRTGHAALRDSGSHPFDRLGDALLPGVERVLVANVAGDQVRDRIAETVSERLGIVCEFVAVEADAYGVVAAYDTPRALGVDRWVAMIAARWNTPGIVCVVNAGTAVTFDAVDASGLHLGGLILPGARLMIGALAAQTTQIELTPPPNQPARGLDVLGTTTETGVGHGAWLALAAGVDRAVGIVADALGAAPRLIVGGGDAEALAAWLESEAVIRPDLVLEGLAIIANQQDEPIA
jgi:type III pantothenate kinase